MEMTQHIAHLVDEEVDDYQQLLVNALNDTSDDETLVDSEEERELNDQEQGRRVGEDIQRRSGQHDAQGQLQRNVRFVPDGVTLIMPPARPRLQSRSRIPTLPPQPSSPSRSSYGSSNAIHPPVPTSQTAPYANQSRTRMSTTYRPDSNRYASISEQIPSTTYQRPVASADGNLPPQSHQYYGIRGQTPVMVNEFEPRSHEASDRNRDFYHPTDLQDMTAAHANRGRDSFVPSPSRSQPTAPHHTRYATDHRTRVYARYGSHVPPGSRQPEPSYHHPAARGPTRFPSLQALRDRQLDPFHSRAPVEPPWGWRAQDEYDPAPMYHAPQSHATTPHSGYVGPNGYHQYQDAFNPAPLGDQFYTLTRQYQTAYDEVQMFAALRLSADDIMNDTMAWQAEADEQRRYMEPGQEHPATRRNNW